MLFICYLYVIYILFIYYLYIIYMLFIYYLYIIYILFIYYLHVIYIIFIYYLYIISYYIHPKEIEKKCYIYNYIYIYIYLYINLYIYIFYYIPIPQIKWKNPSRPPIQINNIDNYFYLRSKKLYPLRRKNEEIRKIK